MVEANTQLLGGTAVTVFLALLFFGVVVLWDVALALRSVGDKIDKLEDNIDDDLTDIAHHLDGMSNARGGGGGTQLHLSGGTISSGPGPNQPQQAPQAGPQQAPQAGPQQAPQAGPQQASQTGHQQGQPTADPPGGVDPQPQSSSQQAERQSAAARRAEEPDEETASSETADPTESPRSDADDPQSDDRADGAADDERSADESASDAESDADDEPSAHPRAERSRGRFITSPDRTAWYATPLDREAIAAARPTIAGALTDGSDDGIDESDVIAAGPVGSSTGAETETHVSAPTAAPEDAVDGEPDDAADGDGSEQIDDPTEDGETAADVREASDAASETTDRADSEPRESGEGEDGDAVDDEADGGLEDAADESSDSPDDFDSLSFDDLTEDADAPAEGAKTASDPDESADDAFADDESENANPDDPDRSDVPDIADDSTELEPAGEDPSLEDDAASDSGGAADTESEADDAAAADALSPFEFDEDEFEAEDVSVEDAVDTMNENAPAPELSSHRFDVTAEETGDGGAVVTLAFEPDTIEIEGSTKRLLQYQLQSFADRESTPAADVTIGRDRIVIEIADSDGTAIQKWGEAAVSIVDRTLYLSDNSPDS